ncbi:MAG: ATP-binding protein [Dongiaceae bacterium]
MAPRRLILAVAAVAAPTLLALAALTATGRLAPLPALVAGLAVAAALAVLVRGQIGRLAAVAGYLRAATSDDDGVAAAAPERPALAPELGEAAVAAVRAWGDRRRRLEAILGANETILASLPDALILLDRERRVVGANPAAEALFGEKLAGRDLVAVLRNPAVIEAVDAALGGAAGRRVEFALPVPVERTLSARVEPLPATGAGGAVALVSLHDLTQAKRAERLRADFVANASHELRTPLSTLVGFIETLRGPARDDTEARERFLAIMQEQAGRMGRLVDDLLSLSRIELDEHSPPTGRVELGRVVAGVADALGLKAAEKAMTIEIGRGLDELPAVVGDADQLAQVFQNLIDNAVKYGRAGSAVRVEGRVAERRLPAARHPAGGAVAVAVRDQGEGIAREHLPRLTERFYRVDSARSRELGGTGLGLAIVKHIVSRHRGALEIESVAGRGSTFTVYLPMADRPPKASRRA